MRTRTKVIKNVFKFGRQGIVDSVRVGREFCSLRLLFGIDLKTAISLGAVLIDVQVYEKSFDYSARTPNRTSGKSDLTNSGIEEGSLKENSSKIKENPLQSFGIDITTLVSNTDAKTVGKKSYDIVEVSSSRVANKDIQNFETKQKTSNQKTPSEQDRRNMILSGKDPVNFRYAHPAKDISSIPRAVPLISDKELPDSYKPPKKDKLSYSEYSVTGQGRPSSYKIGKFESSFYPLYHDMRLKTSDINRLPSVFFVISLMDKNRKFIDYASFNLKLDNVKNAFRIETQTATPDQSYRYRVYQPSGEPSPWTNVKSIESDDFKALTLLPGNPIIVRNKNESKVIHRKPLENAQLVLKSYQVPIFATRSENSYDVTFCSIKDGFYSLQKRRPIRGEKFYDISSGNSVLSKGAKSTVNDTDLSEGETYEYRIKFIDTKGTPRYSSNVLTKKFKSRNTDMPSMASIRVVSEEKSSISFKPSLFIDSSSEKYSKILQSRGIKTDFLSSSNSDVRNYNGSPVFNVVRHDLSTGDAEFLGNYYSDEVIFDGRSSTSMSTSAAPRAEASSDEIMTPTDRQSTSKTPPDPNKEYAYVVSFGIRPPESFSKTDIANSTDQNSTSYSYNPYKFFSRTDFMNIPSESEMLGKSEDIRNFDISKYEIGMEQVVYKRSTTKSTGTIKNLRSERTLLKKNSISWSYEGGKTLDHFEVWATVDGTKSLIGAVDASVPSTGTSYSYLDEQLYDRVGEVTYSIAAVDTNFENAAPEASTSILLSSNLPAFMR